MHDYSFITMTKSSGEVIGVFIVNLGGKPESYIESLIEDNNKIHQSNSVNVIYRFSTEEEIMKYMLTH